MAHPELKSHASRKSPSHFNQWATSFVSKKSSDLPPGHDDLCKAKSPRPVEQPSCRKRPREQFEEPEDTLRQKRARSHLLNCAVESKSDPCNNRSSINYWARKGSWPKEYFAQNSLIVKDYKKDEERRNREHSMAKTLIPKKPFTSLSQSDETSLLEKERSLASFRQSKWDHLLARKKSVSSLSDFNETVSRKSREVKSVPYSHPGYPDLLEAQNSYLKDAQSGINQTCKNDCKKYLLEEQAVPKNTLFDDEYFEAFCEKVQSRSEAMIVQDITRLLVPSAENLAIRDGEKSHLGCLVESVNEPWSNCITALPTRPQPDYCVGFRKSAFTESQIKTIEPFLGDLYDASFFRATWQMYFPFLTCEVKRGVVGLDIADRQNANSMTVAVRAVVELFKCVKRAKDLDRKILAFSVSHDSGSIRIYGHYPLIRENDKIAIYRHSIHKFDFTAQEGKEKWTTYRFIKNVYDKWMPDHLSQIRSAIDQISFEQHQEVQCCAEGLDVQNSQSSDPDLTSVQDKGDNPTVTQETSGSQATGTFKKPRLTVNALLNEQIAQLKQELEREAARHKQEAAELKEQVKGLMELARRNLT